MFNHTLYSIYSIYINIYNSYICFLIEAKPRSIARWRDRLAGWRARGGAGSLPAGLLRGPEGGLRAWCPRWPWGGLRLESPSNSWVFNGFSMSFSWFFNGFCTAFNGFFNGFQWFWGWNIGETGLKVACRHAKLGHWGSTRSSLPQGSLKMKRPKSCGPVGRRASCEPGGPATKVKGFWTFVHESSAVSPRFWGFSGGSRVRTPSSCCSPSRSTSV